MTEHNPWKGDGTPPADDVEIVEAERVPTLNELEGKPIAEQLEALTGAAIPSLTIGEMHAFLHTARWYAQRCRDVGVEPPHDVLRGLGCCAYEVVSYNQHLAEHGDPNARPPVTRH